MNYYNLYLKYKIKYIGLKKILNDNYEISPIGIFNIEKTNKIYDYDLNIIKNLEKNYDCVYKLVKSYVEFVQGSFIEFDVRNKKINKKYGFDIIPYYSIKIYEKDSCILIDFIDNGKKEILIDNEKILIDNFFIYYKTNYKTNYETKHDNPNVILNKDNTNYDNPYVIFNKDNRKVIKFNNYWYKPESNEIYTILNQLFGIDKYLYYSPQIHGGRIGNTLFPYFINVDKIINFININYDEIKCDKNILLITHSYIRTYISLFDTTINKSDTDLYSDYLFKFSDYDYNLFEIKNKIEKIFNYFISYQLKNFVIESFDNTIGLHFRGSDFCVTFENTSVKYFKILHFKFYYDCIHDIIKKNEKINTFYIHIFSHPNDTQTIEILVDYLIKKIKNNFPHIDIFFKYENEIFKEINLTKPTEYDIIKVISTYKYIIMSNSSFILWSGFLSSNSKLYICQSDSDTTIDNKSELKYPIIFKAYSQAFKSLAEHYNAIVLTSKKYEYALSCYIDIGKYIQLKYIDYSLHRNIKDGVELFNYYDFMIILYCINKPLFNCNCNDIYQIGLKQYKTYFGTENSNNLSPNAKRNLNLFKNKSIIIQLLCNLLKDDDNLYNIFNELEEDNKNHLQYKPTIKIYKIINFIKNNKDTNSIDFIYFIILLFLIKKNNFFYTEFIDSLTFGTNIELIVNKFSEKIICEISNYKSKNIKL